MLDRLRRTLVDSYIGAIALGYLLAQDILHFTSIFTSPLTGWLARREYGSLVPHMTTLWQASLEDALLELARFAALLLVWYLLLRWLYFRRSEPAPNAE